MLTHRSFPRAILHVDGDSFFASCEVAKDPSLRGKCVITGKERGIASSMSYEAKARGVTRAMKLSDIRRLIPDAVILPSDYETYSLYSERMYAIVRRYTAAVEEYSIDECFADLTGMRRPDHMPYEAMAVRIKHELDSELGMTFSVGLSVNKVTAKIASKWRKPSGLTVIPGRELDRYLERTAIERVWGIGPNTSAYLRSLGIITALDLARRDDIWVKEHLSKPFQEIHHELNGGFVYPLATDRTRDYASISKTRTFTPPSSDRAYVYSQLSKNVENACIKLRRHGLYARAFAFFLKTQDFRYDGLDIRLDRAVSVPQEILTVIRERFDRVWKPGTLYRATGIALMGLAHEEGRTADLFGKSAAAERIERVYEAVDSVSARYGKHAIFLGSSFKAMMPSAHRGDRGEPSERRAKLMKGETVRRRIGIPFLGPVR